MIKSRISLQLVNFTRADTEDTHILFVQYIKNLFNEISSGGLDDLEKVTKQAYTMVAYYSLDKEIGPISYYDSTV